MILPLEADFCGKVVSNTAIELWHWFGRDDGLAYTSSSNITFLINGNLAFPSVVPET